MATNDDKRKIVYDNLVKTGYGDSFEEFDKFMDDPQKRKIVYDKLKNDTGYSDSFEEFDAFMQRGNQGAEKQVYVAQEEKPTEIATDLSGTNKNKQDLSGINGNAHVNDNGVRDASAPTDWFGVEGRKKESRFAPQGENANILADETTRARRENSPVLNDYTPTPMKAQQDWRTEKERRKDISDAMRNPSVKNPKNGEVSDTELQSEGIKAMEEAGLNTRDKEDIRRQLEFETEREITEANERLNSHFAKIPGLVEYVMQKDTEARDKENREWRKSQDELLKQPGYGQAFTGIYQAHEKEMNQKYGGIDKLVDETYRMLSDEKKSEILGDYFGIDPSEATEEQRKQAEAFIKARIYADVHEAQVGKLAPKSKNEFFIRKVLELNPAVLLANATGGRPQGEAWADMEAMERYGKEHRALDLAGMGVGMMADPTTYAGGGISGAAVKGTTKAVAKRMMKGAAKDVAMRGLSSRLAENAAKNIGFKIGQGMLGGGVNFGFYEGAKEGERQLYMGGTIDEKTGQLKTGEYSFGDMSKQAGHGLGMGAAIGWLNPVFGNVGDKVVKLSDNAVDKAVARTGEFVSSKALEGTIFSIPEWIEGDRDKMDIWEDNLMMVSMFGLQHAMKSVPARLMEMRNESKVSGRGFSEVAKERLDHLHDDRLSMTKTELNELSENGYGSFGEIFVKKGEKNGEAKWEVTKEELKGLDGYEVMGKLMEDKNLSQSTRAKAYHILTGQMLPVSTIASFEREETPEGKHVVKTFSNTGDLITRKEFSNEAEANDEAATAERQIELNNIDFSEKMAEAIADENLFRKAGREIAPGATNATLETLYSLGKSGEVTAPAIKELTERIDSYIEENQGKRLDTPQDVRNLIKAETGVDLDKAIRKEPSSRNEKEKEAVKRYLEELNSIGERQEELRKSEKTLLENSTEIDRLIETLPEEVRKAVKEAQAEERRMAEAEYYSAQMEAAFEDGVDKVKESLEGDNGGRDASAPMEIDEETLALMAEEVQRARDGIEEVFGSDSEEIISLLEEDPMSVLVSDEYDGEKKETALAYVNAMAKLEGASRGIAETVEQKKEEVKKAVEDRTNKETGMIQPAVMKTDDKPVFIVNGKIEMFPDGTGVDSEKSSESIIIFDPEEGRMKFADPRQVSKIEEARPAEKELEEAYAEIDAQASLQSEKLKAENGNIPDENIPEIGNNGEENIPPSSQDAQQEVIGRVPENADLGTSYVPNVPENVLNDAQNVPNGAENVPLLEETELPQTALESIPVDETTGKRNWTAVEPEHAWDALSERYQGNEGKAKGYATMQLESAKKAVKDAEKIKIQPTDDEEAFDRAYDEREQAIEEAKKRLSHWERIVAIPEERRFEREKEEKALREAEEAERKALAKADESLAKAYDEVKDTPEALEHLKDLEPKTMDEVAAMVLSQNKLMWNDEGNRKGVKSETGFGEGERRKLFSIFAPREKGGKSLQKLAEDEMQQMCATYGVPYDNQEARNALIDMISSSTTPSDIRKYIERRRADQALEMKEAILQREAEAEEEFYQTNYGMSKADHDTYEELKHADLTELHENFNEEEYYGRIADELADIEELKEKGLEEMDKNFNPEEYYGNIADELANQERRENERRDSEAGGFPVRSIQEDGREGTVENDVRGGEILPGEETDNPRGFAENEVRQEIFSRDGQKGVDKDADLSGVARGTVEATAGSPREGAYNPLGKLIQQAEESAKEYFDARDLKPIGEGAFGKIYDQFRGKFKDAINFLKRLRGGEAIGALSHHSVGDISLVWGNKKAGLEKIINKHPEVIDNLQGIIDAMEVVEEGENRIRLESPTHYAVVSKDYLGQPRDKWLLTAFEKKEKPVSASSMDIETEPLSGRENGTSTLSNELSKSESKDRENNRFEQQEKKERKDTATLVTPGQPNEGAGAVAPNLSESKDNALPRDKKGEGVESFAVSGFAQGERPKEENFIEKAERIARETQEKKKALQEAESQENRDEEAGSMADEARRSYGRRIARESGKSLFDWADENEAPSKSPIRRESDPEMERAGEEANQAIDKYSENFSKYLRRSEEIEAELAKDGLGEVERLALEQERDVIEEMVIDEKERLKESLKGFYIKNNTHEDAEMLSREMASRVQAEVSVRLNGKRLLDDLLTPEKEIESSSEPISEMKESEGDVKTAGGTISYMAKGHLPDAEKGEFSYVERQFLRSGSFSFTGREKIRDRGDVAYIFRELENYSIENVFAVMQREDGSYKIVHIGKGTPTSSPADLGAIRGAYDAFGANKIWLVHNHPSGVLNASPADRDLMQKIETAFEDLNVETEGIIMDTRSGRYVSFHGEGMSARFERDFEMEETPVDVYSFDRMDRSNEPVEKEKLNQPFHVVNYISKMREGKEPRVSYLLLNNQMEVMGNFHTDCKEMGDPALAEEMASVGIKYGAKAIIPYGNVDLMGVRALNEGVKNYSMGDLRIVDALHIDSDGRHETAYETGLMGEPEGNYGKDSDLTEIQRAKKIQDMKPIEVKPNNLSKEELKEIYNKLDPVEKDGINIEFYKSAFKKVYKEGGLSAQAIPSLREVLENSILAYSEPDNLGGQSRKDGTEHKTHKNILSFDNYVGKIKLEGKEYYVRFTVQNEKERSGTHSFFVSNVELYEKPTESQTIPITSRGTTGFDGIPDTKLAKFFERAKSADENKNEVRDAGASYGRVDLKEAIRSIKEDLKIANKENLEEKKAAMRKIGGNLSKLRQAMARQKEYDRDTASQITGLAQALMDAGLMDTLSKTEFKRILSAVKNAVGKESTAEQVTKVVDIMIDNQLRAGEKAYTDAIKLKTKTDARGVEKGGNLDAEAKDFLVTLRQARALPAETYDAEGGVSKGCIAYRMLEAQDKMGSDDPVIADRAANEYRALQVAFDYSKNIGESKAEERDLRDSLKEAELEYKNGTGGWTKESYRQFVEATENAIRDNKIERAEAYEKLTGELGDMRSESAQRVKEWREAEKKRIQEIHHNANSDMEGRISNEHGRKATRVDRFVNSSAVQFFMKPLATFDQMLRMFGDKNARGEGYLWNRYMRGWLGSQEKEYKGYQNALKELDDKVSNVFKDFNGIKGVKVNKWGDLFTLDRKLPTALVKFWDGGEMREHELTQGNLLYIYLANKMSDGQMKLRKMGVTEENITQIETELLPEFKQLADWMQEEYLPKKREEYNATHQRMFGTGMAAIENYFPLKILSNARVENVDLSEDANRDIALPATSTGSIIKRTRNSLALDLTGANAFSVMLDHLQQMEHWNAFSEFNRDLNTLLSYKGFRNKVMNMNSVYGSGKELWTKFRNSASLAAGSYRPPVADLDKLAVNMAKGVSSAKVSFRVFTALKQFLSFPAYFPEANPLYLAKNIATPMNAWKWSMENLPLFEKRWKSRMAGDPRLLKTNMDWKAWRNQYVQMASRIGMSPNAFVDALTVSMGAYSIYETKLAKYKRMGYDEAKAMEKAKQDATILFNQTQQSSESAFLSTMQVDRSWLSVLFTVFRNSSMSYARQEYDALRNLGKKIKGGKKGYEESVEFMAKQWLREMYPENEGSWSDAQWAKARDNARKEYRTSIGRDIARVATFGFIMQMAWNMGAYLPYMLLGKDEEEKEKMWDDAFTHAMWGSVEGLTAGDAVSNGINYLRGLDSFDWNNMKGLIKAMNKEMPVTSDFQRLSYSDDFVSAMNDVVNLVVQSGFGFNPQSITDAVAAIWDACNGDMETGREAALLMARIANCPPNQLDKIYFDELDTMGTDAARMAPKEIAERYAEYKAIQGAPFTFWMRSDEKEQEIKERKEKRVMGIAKEKLGGKIATDETRRLLAEYDEVKKAEQELSELRNNRDNEGFRDKMDELRSEYGDRWRLKHRLVGRYRREMEELTKLMLATTDVEEMQRIVDRMLEKREEILERTGGL